MPEKIIVSVISDLVTDQRVQKECTTLHHAGYEVLLIGRKSSRDFFLNELPFKTFRFRNLFKRGPGMYLVFNTQLFFYLLFKRADILWSNDLDTLLPNFLISRLKNAKLIYDSHEYFTESVYKPASKKIWSRLESALFPRLKNVITVNDSIKAIYEKKYGVPVTVLRNVPYPFRAGKGKPAVAFAPDKKVLLMQGTGINENRGAEEAVQCMQFLNESFLLYFIGSGTLLPVLKKMVTVLRLEQRVLFIPPLPYPDMMEYTKQAFLGLIFEKIHATDEHLYALPNKLFDYLHAEVPVLASKGVEIERVISSYQVGSFIENFDPHQIAAKITEIAADTATYHTWKQNTLKAAAECNWENEEKILIRFMKQLS